MSGVVQKLEPATLVAPNPWTRGPYRIELVGDTVECVIVDEPIVHSVLVACGECAHEWRQQKPYTTPLACPKCDSGNTCAEDAGAWRAFRRICGLDDV